MLVKSKRSHIKTLADLGFLILLCSRIRLFIDSVISKNDCCKCITSRGCLRSAYSLYDVLKKMNASIGSRGLENVEEQT